MNNTFDIPGYDSWKTSNPFDEYNENEDTKRLVPVKIVTSEENLYKWRDYVSPKKVKIDDLDGRIYFKTNMWIDDDSEEGDQEQIDDQVSAIDYNAFGVIIRPWNEEEYYNL